MATTVGPRTSVPPVVAVVGSRNQLAFSTITPIAFESQVPASQVVGMPSPLVTMTLSSVPNSDGGVLLVGAAAAPAGPIKPMTRAQPTATPSALLIERPPVVRGRDRAYGGL